MREQIYYWKADNPQSRATRKESYFQTKYDRAGLGEVVAQACAAVFGEPPEAVEPVRADGNHLGFTVTHGGQRYFFRADDGSGDDDYLLAESRLMALAAEHGVPVPRVHHTDVSRTHCPWRFQILEFRDEPCLNHYHRDGSLDLAAVGRQLGQLLRRLHAVPLDGFGFVDTDHLAATDAVRGLDRTYSAYFHKRLDEHLGYVREHGLLTPAEAATAADLLRRHAPRLTRAQGVLVHRDLALWNVLGTPHRITAIIDWDDAVSGDPADDFGILRCFYDDAFLAAVGRGYWGEEPEPADFAPRVWLHQLRNLLWKAMLRHQLGYFDQGPDFFLNTPAGGSLREQTLAKLHEALDRLGSCDDP